MGTGSRGPLGSRRTCGTIAVLASAGLLVACGSDDAGNNDGSDGRNITDVTTLDSSDTTTTEETTGETTTGETTETQGSGTGSGSGSGDFNGWADLDAAVADLETIGVSCDPVDMDLLVELGGESAGSPFALCEPESMIMFDEDPEGFRAMMEEEIAADEGDHDVHMILDDNWVMICEGADVTACDDTSEYTGIPSQNIPGEPV